MTTTPKVTVDGWLAFNINGAARWTKGEPTVGRHERAINVRLQVPRALFNTPTLRASITIPDDAAPLAYEIDAQTVAEALKSSLGVDVDVQIIMPEETP
jgi:hypothetical protein